MNLYSKTDFEHLKELGCDVIRLPVHFEMFLDDKGKINPVIFEYLDKACDWAEELEIYLIIDNHSFNSGAYPSAKKLSESLTNLWPQIASRYKNRSQYILYEILNEPQIKNAEWESIQKEILLLIRRTDKNRTVLVTGADWSSLNAMCELSPLDDENIIYTFHYYDPFVFTHQGASWAGSAIEALSDIPFPYDKNRMPKIPKEVSGSWVEGNLNYSYPKDGTEAAMRTQLKW